MWKIECDLNCELCVGQSNSIADEILKRINIGNDDRFDIS